MAGIYLIEQNGNLVELQERPYDSEARLQELLARYPNLLAGDQIERAEPRRWVLVAREMGLPATEDGGDRWAVDHLFLDQDGIPTIVEVKRSSDSRIRREVIGQMLDYAANGVRYWPVETLQVRFEQTCKAHVPPQEPTKMLTAAQIIGTESNEEVAAYWSRVKTNLQAGRVRMAFVADEIPVELARVVEFLNSQMDPAEVIAVEVKQFTNDNASLRTLVPRVLGQTAESQLKKLGGAPPRQWQETSFFDDLRERRGEREASLAREILNWGTQLNLQIVWGQGARDGSFLLRFDVKGVICNLAYVWTYGRVEIQFIRLSRVPPFDSEQKRQELLNRLNRIPGVGLQLDAISRRPSIALELLVAPGALTTLLDALAWVIADAKEAATR